MMDFKHLLLKYLSELKNDIDVECLKGRYTFLSILIEDIEEGRIHENLLSLFDKRYSKGKGLSGEDYKLYRKLKAVIKQQNTKNFVYRRC